MSICRKHIVLILALIGCCNLWGALDTDYRLSIRGGVIMNDGKVDKVSPQRGPTLGGEFAVSFHPQWTCLRDWNHAGLGVALSYYDLGDAQKLGQAIAPYAFIEVPFVRRPHFVLGARIGLGVGFLTRTYTNTIPEEWLYKQVTYTEGGVTQYANHCIGSVTNFYFPEALYMEIPISNGWCITAGGGWYHFSNGSTKQPNSGYNIFTGEIGIKKEVFTTTSPYPWVPVCACKSQAPKKVKPIIAKAWEIDIASTFTGRQVYYRDQATFLASYITAAAYWRAHPVFRLGGGVDIFYDGAYIPRETKFGKTNLDAAREDGSDCWRVGVSIQPEMVVGNFTFGVHIGAYMRDPVKELELDTQRDKEGNLLYATEEQFAQFSAGERVTGKGVFYRYDILKAGSAGYPDGWLYEQVVIRYHLPYHLMLIGNMKAHMAKVEFIGLGIGAHF